MSIDRVSSDAALSTRTSILQASARLLEGGMAPSMSEVADEAGLSRQALYLHFASRAELLLATAEYARAELGVVAAYERLLQEADPDRLLESLMALHLAFTPRVINTSRALEAVRLQDPAFDAAWQQRDQSRLNLMLGVAATLARSARLKAGWSETQAATFLWSITAPSFTDLLLRSGWTPEEAVRRTHEVIIATLLEQKSLKETGMSANPMKVAQDVAQKLEQAWNAADGSAFDGAFADDADFVDIRGDLHHGAQAIGSGHQAIFDSIYKGTTVRYEVIDARPVGDSVLAHLAVDLKGAEAVLPPNKGSIASLVLVPGGDDWRVASFHNTLCMAV